MPRTYTAQDLYLHQRQRGCCQPLQRKPQRASVVFLFLLLTPKSCTSDGIRWNQTFLDDFLLHSTAPELRLYTLRGDVFAGKEASFICMALLGGGSVFFQWLINNREVASDPEETSIPLGPRKLQMRYSVLRINTAHPRDSGAVSCRVTLYGDRLITSKYMLTTDLRVRTVLKPDGTIDYFPVHAYIDELCHHTRKCVGEEVVCDYKMQSDGYDVSRCHCSAGTYFYKKLGQCVRERRLGEPCYIGVQCREPASRCDQTKNTCGCETGFKNNTVGCTAHVSLGDFCDVTHSCTKGTVCVSGVCTCAPDYYWSTLGCRKRLLSSGRTRFLFKVLLVCCSITFVIIINCLLFYFKYNTYEPSLIDHQSRTKTSWSLTRSLQSRGKSLTPRSSGPDSFIH